MIPLFSHLDPLILRIPDEPPYYVRQATLCFTCLGDKCISCSMCMSTALTQHSSLGFLNLMV